jgi:hypothetical protein
MDAVKNFGVVTSSTGYDAAATSIVLSAGHGAKLPDPVVDGEYNLVWFDSTNFTNPAEDPNVEIIRVTGPAGTGDTKTILRAQEGTVASNKNTAGATYTMVLGTTAKIITDIESEIAASDQNASEVPFSPTPGIASNQVQGAIEELESDVDIKLAGKAATDRKLDDFGTPDDNTDLDSSITRHGLLPKLGGGSTNYLRADGTWAAPGGGGDMLKSVYDTDDNGIVDNAESVVDNAITNAKLANMAGQTIKGNQLLGYEDPADLTPAQVRSLINVEDGAAADQNASEVPNTPAGNIAATDIQAAINELDTEKAAAGDNSDITQLSGLTTDLSIAQGGTGESTEQAAIDALSSAAGATNEHVLTKDTVSGNAIFKAAAGGFADPMTTRGDIIIRDPSNNTNRLGIGPAGQFIKSDGTDIEWGTAGGGGDMLKSVYDTDDDGVVDEAEVITGQGALATLNTVDTSQIDNSAVINGKLADVPGHTLKGNPDIGTNPPQDLNAGSVRSILNVEDGAAADQNASEVPFSPTPGIGSNQVQGAIEELETDVDTKLAGKAATDRKLDDFGTPDDNTDLDSSVSRHGLLPKLGGGSTNFLRADGSWAAPAGGGDMLKSVYDIDDSGIVDNAETVVDNAITNAKLANMAGQTIKGNQLIGSEDPTDLTPAQVRSLINVADGADVTGSNPPQAHDLSGALHNNTLLAALNAKITDATLIDTGDSRLSDSRDPTAHNTSHQNGGADQIRIDNFQEGEDNTDLDSSTGRHGLLPKLGGGSTNFLRADGSWAAPGGGGSVVIASGSYTGDDSVNRAIPHGLAVVPKFILMTMSGVGGFPRLIKIGAVNYVSSTSNAEYSVTNWTSTDFYVGNSTAYNPSGNGSSYTYYWVAVA